MTVLIITNIILVAAVGLDVLLWLVDNAKNKRPIIIKEARALRSYYEEKLSGFIRALYTELPTDGKFIYDEQTQTFIACQSNTNGYDLEQMIKFNIKGVQKVIVNPLGEWTGGTNVDTGATNRKLGSDMGRAVTGGGLHGKDLSKADVSVNIVCHILAQQSEDTVEALCAIGNTQVTFRRGDGEEVKLDYKDVVEMARQYINNLGGFEKLAEWGLF